MAKDAVHESQDGGNAASRQEKTRRGPLISAGNRTPTPVLDRTCYFIAASSSKTNRCIDLIADHISNMSITQADFDREHGVVQRELEMGKDSPSRQMWYAHSANLFGTHPRRALPVIGFRQTAASVDPRRRAEIRRRHVRTAEHGFCRSWGREHTGSPEAFGPTVRRF